MNKTQISIFIASLYLGASGLVLAEDTTITVNEPISQAVISVDKNLTRDPDNKGLKNAAARLETNQDRIQEKRDSKAEKLDKVKKAEKLEKSAKFEKAARLEKTEKVEKLEKAERPEKVEKVDRPEKVK